MSNKDTCPQASQAAAQAAFVAEITQAQIQGDADLARYYADWASRNTGNKLYKNA